ncbi:MAG: non-histone chromosomal MC1 family protein, partial [Candidatus Altiarchaeota archaeon]
EHIFSGKQPRQAALKAATRGFKTINLRERGAKKVHMFTGSVETVDAPANRPAWLPAKVKKAKVKKIGIKRL